MGENMHHFVAQMTRLRSSGVKVLSKEPLELGQELKHRDRQARYTKICSLQP